MVIKKANRNKKKSAKTGVYWCGHCDANLVGANEKCSVCGKRDGSLSFKKSDNPPPFEF